MTHRLRVLCLGALALAACSGSSDDELGNTGDAGASVGDGGADGGGPRLDAGADAGASDAAQGELDAAQADAAAPPSRSNLSLSNNNVSVARCASASVDVSWQGDPSAPSFTVQGLPEGVSYQVELTGERMAKIRMAAGNGSPLDSGHNLVVRAAADATSPALETALTLSIPATFAVTARVLDSEGMPVQGASVTVNGDLTAAALSTDAAGEVSIADVTAPYDLFVVANPAAPAAPAAIEYQGLTRCDPRVVPAGARLGPAASLSGTLTPPSTDESFDLGGRFYLGGPGLEQGAITSVTGSLSSSFALPARWRSDGAFMDSLFAVWIQDGPVYRAAGGATVMALPGANLENLQIPLTQPLSTRQHSIDLSLGAYRQGRTFLGLMAFDVPGGRIDAVPPGVSVNDFGSFVAGAANSASLTTLLPNGKTVFAIASADDGDATLLQVAAAAEGASTALSFPATAPMATVSWEGILSDAPVSFSWTAVPGASAMLIDFPGSVRAVLPGDATTYTTDRVFARGAVPDESTCSGVWHISAVFLEGYDADTEADGSGRAMPLELSDMAEGPGRLFGVEEARVYTWTYFACT